MRCVLVLACLTACQSRSDPGTAGRAAAGSAVASGDAAVASGSAASDCTAIKLCEAFPAAHVDQLCGSKTVKSGAVDDAPNGNVMIDSCQYLDDKGNTGAIIIRRCFPASLGGSEAAHQQFKTQHDGKAQGDLQIDLQPIGDESYYRFTAAKTQSDVAVRKGNVVMTIRSQTVTATTESVIQKQCLLQLYRELAAK